MEHTCQYCDGTLQSARPVCGYCGHPLTQQIEKYSEMKVYDYLLGFPRHIQVFVNKTVCPKCLALNTLDDSLSTVQMVAHLRR